MELYAMTNTEHPSQSKWTPIHIFPPAATKSIELLFIQNTD